MRAGPSWRFPGGESLQEQQDRVMAALYGYPRRRRAAGARGVPRRVDPGDAVQPRSAGSRRVSCVRGPERGRRAAVSRSRPWPRLARPSEEPESPVATNTSRLPTIAFAVLVAATIAAFFVTQHLKVTTPLIQGYAAPGARGDQPASRGPVRQLDTAGRPTISFYLQHRGDDVDVYRGRRGREHRAHGGHRAPHAQGRAQPRRRVPLGRARWRTGGSHPTAPTTSGCRCVHQGRTIDLTDVPVKVKTVPPHPV